MISRLLRILFHGIFGLLMLFVVFLGYGNLPNRWYHILYIYSGSMSPAMRAGDLIIITPPPSVLKPGMVLTLSVNGHLVTHRLVGFGEYGELVTQGDANTVVDDWGEASISVAGIYRTRIPYLGYLAALPARFSNLIFSGAWFAESESITGELGATTGWLTPAPPSNDYNLRGTLAASPFYENGLNGVDLRLCLINNGSNRIDDLHIHNLIQVSRGVDGFSDYLAQYLDLGAHPSLNLGEEHCYETRIVIDPEDGKKYRDQVRVFINQPPIEQLNSSLLSQDTPVEIALELATDFSLLDPQALPASPTPTALPTFTPFPPIPATPTITPAPAVENTRATTATPSPAFSPTSTAERLRATPTDAPIENPTANSASILPTEPVEPSQTPRPGRNCVYPLDYWREHTEAWPVDKIDLGDQVIDKQAMVDLLSDDPRNDARLELVQALIAAKLNISNGVDGREAADEISAADDWFTDHPAGSIPTEADAERAEDLAKRLDSFNQGLSGPRACLPSTATPAPTLTYTPTSPVPTSSPAVTPTPTAPGSPTPSPATPTAEPTIEPTPTPTATPGSDPDPFEWRPAHTPTPPTAEPLPVETPVPTQAAPAATPNLSP